MRARRYLQLDVFAARPGTGNPLGVIPDADDIDTDSMQALAAWLNLSETVFFLAPDLPGADYRIRIFTPRGELPFAGHPSVGAAWWAIESGRVPAPGPGGQIVQQCAAGLLPVRTGLSDDQRVVSVRSPSACQLLAAPPPLPPELAAIAVDEPTLWSNGPEWWLLEVCDEAALRRLEPDLCAIAALPRCGKLAAFAVADRGAGYQLVLRAFAPGSGIAEDPVTGSANALVAAMLHARGRLPGRDRRYVASQGRELGRDGHVEVRIDEDGEVWIGGQVQAVISGELRWR